MFAKLKALWTLKKLMNTATKQVDTGGGKMKASFLTGEFWIAVLSNVPMLICSVNGHDSIPCLALSAISNAVFMWKRGTLKEKALELGIIAAKDMADEKVEPAPAPEVPKGPVG